MPYQIINKDRRRLSIDEARLILNAISYNDKVEITEDMVWIYNEGNVTLHPKEGMAVLDIDINQYSAERGIKEISVLMEALNSKKLRLEEI